jgi:hypothetical protein
MLGEIILNERSLQGITPVLDEIETERERQINKWGAQDHYPQMWYAILGEEFGEVGKEIAESHVKEFDVAAYRKELIQVAAVAAAAIQCIDNGVA